jgi:hypothetical protein
MLGKAPALMVLLNAGMSLGLEPGSRVLARGRRGLGDFRQGLATAGGRRRRATGWFDGYFLVAGLALDRSSRALLEVRRGSSVIVRQTTPRAWAREA